jgi:CHASE2 domain-containing sensor protein
MGEQRRRKRTPLSWLDATMAASAHAFIRWWTILERSYKRPFSRFARRLRFAFYPLLAIGAIAWLGWDWGIAGIGGARSLDSAEDAVFDKVIKSRPFEPPASKRVVVVEIDDCSIEHFLNQGEGGWPWSRQRHADLLDALDRAGIRAVGYDVMFTEPSPTDPIGDETLEAMAAGGNGRFLFGASRVHEDFDASKGATPASLAPGAFALAPRAAKPGPKVALLLPYGEAMRTHSALLDVDRGQDGVLRDVPLRATAGDWAIPSMALRLATRDTGRRADSFPASVRVNWRSRERLPYISAADLIEGKPICRAKGEAPPALKGKIALVGYTASGLNDAKPTPVDATMPGVEVHAEATAALVDDSAIWMPPAWLKYILASVLVLLTTFAFFRGEPASDIDSIFVAVNFALLALAYAGLTFFGWFFDIYASIGFVSLFFGLCRAYAGIQRGRAVGNGDFLAEFDPATDRWLVFVRLRFVPYPSLDKAAASRRRREYRRRLRRFLYAGCDAVMLEGVVERKSWLHATLDDLMLLVWKAPDEPTARAIAERDLDALHVHLNEYEHLDDDGMVKVCSVAAEIDDDLDDSDRGERLRLREALGRLLDANREWPLSARNTLIHEVEDAAETDIATPGEIACTAPSAATASSTH